MTINSNGLTIKRYSEILEDLENSLRSFLGNNIDLSENALLGILNIIYANAQAEQWEMAEAVYNAFNIEGATGKQLDDLVALVGLSRLAESFTSGIVEMTGTSGTLIPQQTEFVTSDTSTSIYLENDITISNSNCMRAILNLDVIDDGTLYTINVGGQQYQYTSGFGATGDEILLALRDAINFDIDASWSATFTVGDTFMIVEADQISYPLAVLVDTNFSLGDVTSIGLASTDIVGEIFVFPDTVTEIITPISGLTSVNNSTAFNTGRLQETDEELRARHSISTAIIGSSSPDSIEAKVNALDGVTFAEVYENTTLFTNARGLPPKSFEVVVDGGTDAVIASTIYDEKPAGVETYGNTVVSVTDSGGQLKAVKFTRPVSVIVYIDVKYEIYDEEVFPDNGEELIKLAVESYNDDLSLGEDVIAQRIFGNIYRSIDGIQSLSIKLGYDSSNVDLSILPIDSEERGLILTDNITVGLGS